MVANTLMVRCDPLPLRLDFTMLLKMVDTMVKHLDAVTIDNTLEYYAEYSRTMHTFDQLREVVMPTEAATDPAVSELFAILQMVKATEQKCRMYKYSSGKLGLEHEAAHGLTQNRRALVTWANTIRERSTYLTEGHE